MLIGSPLIFVPGVARVKSVRSREVHRSGAPCSYAKIHWFIGHACVQESAPCDDQCRTDDRVKLHRMSICAERLFVLCGL
jgi:hypothetical protein